MNTMKTPNFFLRPEMELWSPKVAGSEMNQPRNPNRFIRQQKALEFDPEQFLYTKYLKQNTVAWLDICCGKDRSLSLVEQFFNTKPIYKATLLSGHDPLADFDTNTSKSMVKYFQIPLSEFNTINKYDLITCTSCLHLNDDKLQIIEKAVSSLKNEGLIWTNFDLDPLFIEKLAINGIKVFLSKQGIVYNCKN